MGSEQAVPRRPIVNMDVATDWLFGSKCRSLQRHHPTEWAWYWCAYLALLGEAWRSMDRSISLRESYPATMWPAIEHASEALQAVGLLDSSDRIPEDAWNDRVQPAITRILARRTAGAIGGLASQDRRNNRSNDGSNDSRTAGSTLAYSTEPNLPVDRSTIDNEEPRTMMGWRSKTPPTADIKQQEANWWIPCQVCSVVGRKHPASGDHPFQPQQAPS